MAKNPPDERLVYLALKHVFKGNATKSQRKKKWITKHLEEHIDNAEIRALVEEYNIDNICNAARKLLDDGIFASTLKAKMRFPEVFEVSPAQSAERDVSEAEAAQSEVNVLRDITEPALNGKAKFNENEPPKEEQKQSSSTSVTTQSLYPVYLPLKSQHRLLRKVQAMLEDSCFAFAERKLPSILSEKDWDCPESAELNLWADVLRKNQNSLDTHLVSELGKSFSDLLVTIAHLRHTAVHRLHVTAARVEQFLVEAEYLAIMLDDKACSQTLSKFRRDARQVVQEFERNKDLLELKRKEKVAQIAAQRAELDRMEVSMTTEILRDDKEYQNLAGMSLEQSMNTPNTVIHSATVSEHETDTELDSEDYERCPSGGMRPESEWTTG